MHRRWNNSPRPKLHYAKAREEREEKAKKKERNVDWSGGGYLPTRFRLHRDDVGDVHSLTYRPKYEHTFRGQFEFELVAATHTCKTRGRNVGHFSGAHGTRTRRADGWLVGRETGLGRRRE